MTTNPNEDTCPTCGHECCESFIGQPCSHQSEPTLTSIVISDQPTFWETCGKGIRNEPKFKTLSVSGAIYEVCKDALAWYDNKSMFDKNKRTPRAKKVNRDKP